MKRELVITKDGSHTLFVPELNEHYHSTNGAVAESLHVFIHSGLDLFIDKTKEINILEIGFGTGLNAALTENFTSKHQLKIYYTAIEAFPLMPEIVQQLNYSECDNIHQDFFHKIHQSAWDESFHEIQHDFYLKKINILLENYLLNHNEFNLIYFDAFSPEVQPILWTKDIFEKLFYSLKNGGILTTYSAKGEVRRTMQSVGFSVDRLPGALGKREMLSARKD